MEIKKCSKADSEYPKALKRYSQAPEILYYIGDISLCNDDVFCVIGKRETSIEALSIAKEIGNYLAERSITVLNGMARGCDTYALKGTLEKQGKTICVMPCGLDTPYPPSNKLLFEHIISSGGCIISEYPIGSKPQKHQFLQRDRIQVMLSAKVIVVDCEQSGGTFYTAETAIKYGKTIGCCVYPQMSAGNVNLVESRKAIPITSCSDIDSFAKIVEYEQIMFNFA